MARLQRKRGPAPGLWRQTAEALTSGGGHGHGPLVCLQAHAVWRLYAARRRVFDVKQHYPLCRYKPQLSIATRLSANISLRR